MLSAASETNTATRHWRTQEPPYFRLLREIDGEEEVNAVVKRANTRD
jgi:hypothetical protein